MKIAYIFRGQPRQTSICSRLFRHYTVDRMPQHDFTAHIYAWSTTNTNSGGTVQTPHQHNRAQLKDRLTQEYKPQSIHVADDTVHYRDICMEYAKYSGLNSVVVYWKLSQVIAEIRAQQQLLDYCKAHDYEPDLIVDTRTEAFHWIHGDFFERSVDKLDKQSDSILVHHLLSMDPHRSVADFTFVYNMNTLKNMCKENSHTRITNSLYSDTTHNELINNNTWNSHTLYPLIAHTNQDYIEIAINQLKLTVVNDAHNSNILTEEATLANYFLYSESQEQLMGNPHDVDLDAIHNTLYTKLKIY